jgi:hypothetical protein
VVLKILYFEFERGQLRVRKPWPLPCPLHLPTSLELGQVVKETLPYASSYPTFILPNFDNLSINGRFTITKSLEFKVFMVNRKEQAKVKAQQNSFEPKKVLSSKVRLNEADKALGFRVLDVEKALKRKREVELMNKE